MPGCASSLKCTTGSTLSAVPTHNRLHTNGFRLTAPDDPSTSHSPASSVSKPNEEGGSSASGVDLVRSADLSLDEDLINTILDAAHAVDAMEAILDWDASSLPLALRCRVRDAGESLRKAQKLIKDATSPCIECDFLS